MIPDWIFRRSVVWIFFYFIFQCRIWWQNTKPKLIPTIPSLVSSLPLTHSIFHEDLNSFFMRLGFIVVIPLKKSVDFSLKWVNDKRVSQSVECLWKKRRRRVKYVAGRKFFVHCWRNSRQATIAREMSDDSMIEM